MKFYDELHSICEACSYGMGDFPSLFPTPETYLEHLFFVIGNGCEIDEETSSPEVSGHPIHLYPVFDREKAREGKKEDWTSRITWKNRYRNEVDEHLGREARPDDDLFKELEKHVFPNICPGELILSSFLSQIPKRIEDETRQRTIKVRRNLRKNEDCEYRYIRPYPLSESYSLLYLLTGDSPQSVLWVAYNLASAWKIHLTDELEQGRTFENSYASKEWTEKHRDMLSNRAEELKNMLKVDPRNYERIALL